MSSTYKSFVIGQQTARKKTFIKKEHTENDSTGTNHTCKMENENECWEIACCSL